MTLMSGVIVYVSVQINSTMQTWLFKACFLFFLSHRKGKLKANHIRDLARIVRSHPIDEDRSEHDQNGHPFLYDLELVLGGKLNGVPRYELQYTTAFEEGMTGESRRRRKRKPTQLQEENNSAGPAEKKSSAAKKKNSPPSNSKNNAKATSTKTTTAKSANNKRRGSKTSGNTNGKKKSKSSKSTATAASETTKVTIINASNAGNGLGMIERHRREFERCLLRLQKFDVYNFFSEDDVPPEYDECYESNSTPVSDENTATNIGERNLSIAPLTSTNPSTALDTALSGENENDKNKETAQIVFPDHPPYNFVVLRKRLDQGRYLLDRQRLTDNEENFHPDGTKIMDHDRKSPRPPSSTIEHPVGIHWELFRDDVIGMCNSAVERNSNDFDDGTPGTLSNTAEKIKTTMDQIYEKTGRKQSKEMELSNDANRYTKIFEGTENKEAALQGKSWRRKG